MTYQHQDLAAGRWKTMSFCEQMANVGSEIERAFNEEAEGVLSLLYNLMQKYEQGQWQSAAAYAQKIELSEGQVLLGYREALNWAQDVFTGNY